MRLLLSDADARAVAERLGTDVATLHADLCRQFRRKLRPIFIICLVIVLVIAAFGVLSGSVIDLSTVSNFFSELFHVWSTSVSASHLLISPISQPVVAGSATLRLDNGPS